MTRFLLPFLLLAASPIAAGTVKQQKGPATLEFQFPGETQSLALADLLAVTLTIEGHSSLRVDAPKELAAAQPWLLVERSAVDRQRIGTDRVRWQLRYRFAPREPGKSIPFAFPEVVLREGDDEAKSVTFAPIEFEVVTSIAPGGELRDITAIEVVPEPPVADSQWHWLALAGLVFGALLVSLVIRLALRRRNIRTNAQITLYELQRLAAMNLPERQRSERFITLLTVIVRRYLERQFAVPAHRQTMPEFLRQLEQQPTLTSAEKRFLAEFLQSSEAVKFANQMMSLDECRRWSEAVKHFLQQRADS